MSRRTAPSPGVWRRRELRRRVDGLHRQRVRVEEVEWAREAEEQAHLHKDIQTARPLTLAHHVAEELRRRRRGKVIDDKMLELVRGRAMAEATWAATRDDSPVACAVFAVDTALHWTQRPLRFDTAPPGCFIRGRGRASFYDGLKARWVWPVGNGGTPDEDDRIDLDLGDDIEEEDTLDRHKQPGDDLPEEPDTMMPVPLMDKDLARLRRLVIDLDRVRSTGASQASWAPSVKANIYTCDVIRPPLEALLLVKHALADLASSDASVSLAETPAAMCIGTGWGGAAQALSALLPLHWVYHQPWPYHEATSPPLDWEVVVLNVPSRHHWRAARLVATPGTVPHHIQRRILRDVERSSGGGHVKMLVEAALKHVRQGTIIALMADERTYLQASGHMRISRKVESLLVLDLDTDDQPVWVSYQQKPWTPHNLPRPSARLVSFWRGTP